MTNTPLWPLTSDSSAKQVIMLFQDEWFPSDPLTVYTLPRLVLPAPLVDKALLDRDDDKEEL